MTPYNALKINLNSMSIMSAVFVFVQHVVTVFEVPNAISKVSLVSTLFPIHCRYMYHTIVTQLLSVSTLTKVISNKNVFILSVSKRKTSKMHTKNLTVKSKNYGVFFKDCKFWYMPKILQFRKTFLGIAVN